MLIVDAETNTILFASEKRRVRKLRNEKKGAAPAKLPSLVEEGWHPLRMTGSDGWFSSFLNLDF